LAIDADHSGIPADVVAHRLMGDWKPSEDFYTRLTDPEISDSLASQPYPFCLAHPIENERGPESIGKAVEYIAEWKRDGIRGQVIRRSDGFYLWSRGEELMENRWPEIEAAAALLPEGTVIDGEILAMVPGGQVLPFAQLQRRIGRWRHDKKPEDANTLTELLELLPQE
jgi:DNA ligase-1